MLKICLLVSLFSLLDVQANVVLAQRIWVSAQAQDYQSKQFLTATWEWSDVTDKRIIQQEASSSGFSNVVSTKARYLTVTSSGYRSMHLPIHWLRIDSDSMSFRFVIPLVPIDKPAVNQPYFQSEQRPLQLTASAIGNTRIPVKFSIRDVLTNRSVKANVCLFFTHTHTQHCYAISTLTTQLVHPDIIAIEVQATGYQPYLGNLVTAKSISDSALSCIITLNPTPTILLVTLPKSPANLVLNSLRTKASYNLTTVDNSRFFVAAKPGLYQLLSNARQPQVPVDTLTLKEGLNVYTQNTTRAIINQSHVQEAIIYFTQSSYELSDSSKQQLSRIALIMKQNPEVSVQIIGHTDNIGNPQLNMTLSEFRARITKGYLQHLGVQSGRIFLAAVGAGQPIIDNDTEENRRKNRRATLLLH